MSIELTATNLKNALWDTLNDIKSGTVQPGQGDAIAAQARENPSHGQGAVAGNEPEQA